jgi:hypothetical protein
MQQRVKTVTWLRRLASGGLLPRRPGFAPGLARVGFVVDRVAPGRGFIRVRRFSPVVIIPPDSLFLYNHEDEQWSICWPKFGNIQSAFHEKVPAEGGGVGSGAVRGECVLVGGLKCCYWWKTV